MTALSRRKAIQTAGAVVLAVPFAASPSMASNLPRATQPDPLLALEAQRVEATDAAGRVENAWKAALEKARAVLSKPAAHPIYPSSLTDPDNPTPDGEPLDQSDLSSLVAVLFAERQDPQAIAKMQSEQNEHKLKKARFLSPGTEQLLPEWRSFVDRWSDAHQEAKEQHTRAIEEYEQAKEAIHERPEIQQLDEVRGDVDDQLSNIEHQIIATRATTSEGLAVKKRFGEELLSDDELETRLFRSIYEDAAQCMARYVS